MRRVTIVSVLVLAAVALGYAAWVRATGPLTVEVAEVRRGAITASFTADGIVKARTVEIASRMAGRVAAILVREGQVVRPGQVLLRLEARDLEAGVVEADAAERAARMAVVQAEVALALTSRQTRAQQALAAAELSAAQSRLQQAQSGARPQEIEQARQRVEAARAVLAAAEQALRRARDLHAAGGLARADLESAEERQRVAAAEHRAAVEALELLQAGMRPEEIAQAQAQVDAARARVEAALAAGLEVRLREAEAGAARARLGQARAAVERARARLADAAVEAPFAGVISRADVEVGQLISPAAPVLTLVDPSDVWIGADIADEDAAKVRPGLPVAVTAPAYPGRRFRGRIAEVAPQAELKIEAALRTRIVRVKVALLEGTDVLRPGLEVDVEGDSPVVPSALLAPSDAVVLREERAVVFRLEGGRVRERQVRVGYATYAVTEILEGLAEGDLVVTHGKDALTDGQRVRVAGAGTP